MCLHYSGVNVIQLLRSTSGLPEIRAQDCQVSLFCELLHVEGFPGHGRISYGGADCESRDASRIHEILGVPMSLSCWWTGSSILICQINPVLHVCSVLRGRHLQVRRNGDNICSVLQGKHRLVAHGYGFRTRCQTILHPVQESRTSIAAHIASIRINHQDHECLASQILV